MTEQPHPSNRPSPVFARRVEAVMHALAPRCPKCGGPTYDNRSRKAAGEYKPNAPDYTCQDSQTCGTAIWPKRSAHE